MRVHYAHLLERRPGGSLLRIAFANRDATAATPTGGVTITIAADPGVWAGGEWTIPGAALASQMDLPAGRMVLRLPGFTMSTDITLELQGAGALPRVSSLGYRPEPPLADHLHAAWLPPLDADPRTAAGRRNVVFVLDISGSMTGRKLQEAQKAVTAAIRSLTPTDWYGLVAFDSDVYVFRPEMTAGSDTAGAIAWVSQLRGGSYTALSAALAAGAEVGATSTLDGASIDLLLVTDGQPNVGSSTAPAILADVATVTEKVGRRARIFGCGIGSDLDQQLLNGLASGTGGEMVFALDDGVIAGQVLELFGRVREGGLTDAAVTLEGDGVEADRQFGWRSLFPGATLSLGAKGLISGPVTLWLQGVAADQGAVELHDQAAPTVGSSGVYLVAAPLAAKAWADQLERDVDRLGETDERVAAAVVLAQTYGIVTRYSSLLALESAEMYAEYGVELIRGMPPASRSGRCRARVWTSPASGAPARTTAEEEAPSRLSPHRTAAYAAAP